MDMTLKDLMKTTPTELAALQHDKLKEHILQVLDNVRECIVDENYSDVANLTFSSPSGDGYGRDDECIDFSYDGCDYVDIETILNELVSLSRVRDGV